MGNITETDHFEKLQREVEDTMQEDEKLVFKEQFGDDKDKCTVCNVDDGKAWALASKLYNIGNYFYSKGY